MAVRGLRHLAEAAPSPSAGTAASIVVPRFGAALDAQLAADEVDPLPHADQPEMAARHRGRVEAVAVVGDARAGPRRPRDQMRIVAVDALACFTTLWSASWPMR